MNYGCSFTKMQFQSLVFVVTFSLLKCIDLTNSQFYDVPPSPCPQFFQYKYNGNDWIGEVELPSPPIEHHEVILHITLSLKAATTVRLGAVAVSVACVLVRCCFLVEEKQ